MYLNLPVWYKKLPEGKCGETYQQKESKILYIYILNWLFSPFQN